MARSQACDRRGAASEARCASCPRKHRPLNRNSRPSTRHDQICTQTARPFPEPLREAVVAVADLLGLAADWFNGGPTAQLRQGLPEGFASRTRRIAFGGLTVQVAGRFDQICLKLYAAADHAPGSKHVADLRSLAATAQELRHAAIWVKTQDASPDFERFVDQVIEHLEASRDDRQR